jgi:lysine-ketoglutarate reductase/saccharopine dehydrogenase-like protein (TIGR00300 family)
METEVVELRGHIIDSLTLPKVLDEILALNGSFEIEEMRVGSRREDSSYARIRVEATDAPTLSTILSTIKVQGAELVGEKDATLVEATSDGVFPDRFYVTTNLPTFVRLDGKWTAVERQRMDCGIVVRPDGSANTIRFPQVKRGDQIVVGDSGVKVQPLDRPVDGRGVFEFMASSVSAEKPKAALIATIAQAIKSTKRSGRKVLLVAGPALVHTGAVPHVVRLIDDGYVDLLFAGNALAAHDIEAALMGTSLGVNIEKGTPSKEGHENHIRAINAVRGAGGIRPAVEKGLIKSGIMHACVKNGVDFVLAGSIRDDGPIPDVITDVIKAQEAMAERVSDVGMALMVATGLHSIAVGNMLPASTRTVVVDIEASLVTKLADRGTHQAVGLVSDVEPFFNELLHHFGE